MMIFFPWYPAFMLAMESSSVIQSRLQLLSVGGDVAFDEAKLMVREKIQANCEALMALFGGETHVVVIERYREHVAHNALRLSGMQISAP